MASPGENEGTKESAKDSNSEEKSLIGLTALLKYKELISVVLFFGSGIVWIYGVFATKEQTRMLKCLIDGNVAMLSGQVAEQQTSALLIENIQEQQRLVARKDSLTDSETKKLASLQAVSKTIEEQVKSATRLREEGVSILKKGCAQDLELHSATK